ncbi:MAG: hypothetical protein P8J14_06480 [Emcibacteraceae bacterium]|nr:hypothetical protein [Emcibacteraceae bacterium]
MTKIKAKFNKIDNVIQKAIDLLKVNDITEGVKNITSLATSFAEAGLGVNSFLDMRVFIIESARKENKTPFLDERIKAEELKLKGERNDRRKESNQETNSRPITH